MCLCTKRKVKICRHDHICWVDDIIPQHHKIERCSNKIQFQLFAKCFIPLKMIHLLRSLVHNKICIFSNFHQLIQKIYSSVQQYCIKQATQFSKRFNHQNRIRGAWPFSQNKKHTQRNSVNWESKKRQSKTTLIYLVPTDQMRQGDTTLSKLFTARGKLVPKKSKNPNLNQTLWVFLYWCAA